MAESMTLSWPQPCAGFRSRKAAQMCAYFATQSGGTIEKLKLIKLIYLAERKHLFEHHHPMLFDEFYSLPHGPICSSTLNGINGMVHEALWDEYVARNGNINGNIVVAVKAVAREDLDEISDAEMTAITEVWGEFSNMTAWQIRNYTHDNCPEYTETANARISISYRQIFEALGEEDAGGISQSISELVKLEGILGSKMNENGLGEAPRFFCLTPTMILTNIICVLY